MYIVLYLVFLTPFFIKANDNFQSNHSFYNPTFFYYVTENIYWFVLLLHFIIFGERYEIIEKFYSLVKF